MNALKGAQARRQFAEGRWKMTILAGEHDLVFAFVGLDDHDLLVER